MVNLYNLSVGDTLVRGKGVFTRHFGIFVGWHNGQFWVAENNSPHGVRYVTYEQFLGGQDLVRIEPFKGNESERSQIIPFIDRLVGKGYDLFGYNCEHFVNHVLSGVIRSRQVQIAGGLAIGALLLWAVTRRKAS